MITSQQCSREQKIERVKGKYHFITQQGRDISVRCGGLDYTNGSALLTVKMPNQSETKIKTTCWQHPEEAADCVLFHKGNGCLYKNTL